MSGDRVARLSEPQRVALVAAASSGGNEGADLYWVRPNTLTSLERLGLIYCVDHFAADSRYRVTSAGRAALAEEELAAVQGERRVLADALRDCMADLAVSQDDAQAARSILDDHRAAVAAYEAATSEPTP